MGWTAPFHRCSVHKHMHTVRSPIDILLAYRAAVGMFALLYGKPEEKAQRQW